MLSFFKKLFDYKNESINTPTLSNIQGFDGSALTVSEIAKQVTFYTCVKIISESISQMPLILYKRAEEGRKRAESHHLYRILKNYPNHWQTASEF